MAYGNGSAVELEGVGISATEYAQRTRNLIRLITELRGVGAHSDVDLPRIAVIGNQSAGKSSIVEAISGITVPRGSGTCTRCPMECRLQHTSDPWSCQVLLRFEKDETGKPISDVHEVKFGPLLTDRSELEAMLRRAQLAILNPSVPHGDFVNFDPSQVGAGQPAMGKKKPLQFSSNTVALDISGPDLTDLAFVDLPGIISNVGEGEDRNNIELIKNLVKEHIKGNTLILLTLTMRDDMENQSAALLAEEADPKRTRTIGVLTKADAMFKGEEPAWLDVLEGRRHSLEHGYYVTKQPGTEELGKKPSFEEAREQEEFFFSNNEPWMSSSNQIRSRTGIPNLTTELSKLLSHLIMQALPKLREDARRAQEVTVEALIELPPPLPDNPVVELLRLFTAFSTETNRWINGTDQCEGLIQLYRAASAEFSSNILLTIPDLRPFRDADEEKELNVGKCFDPRIEDDPEVTVSKASGRVERFSSPMYLHEVRDHVKMTTTRELPYNVPYAAKRGLIEKSFVTWDQHALAYFETVCEATINQLDKIIETNFSRFVMSPLKANVKSVIEKQVNRFRKETADRITWFLNLERPPFTQNLHYFTSLREKYLSKYKAARTAKRMNITAYNATNALSHLANLGFKGLTVEDLHKLSEKDSYEEELIVMAEASAYFRIAYKRIIDDLPRIVDHDFFRALEKHIPDALVNEFGLGSEKATERATHYLADDPSNVIKRDELRAKQRRLDEVQKKLFNFGL